MMTKTDLETMWDVNDVAKFLRVSRSWVYQRVEAGLLPHLRVGGLVRFEPHTLREFVRRERLSASCVVKRLAENRS
ncbi:MAG: helix-turn-helix domain-containing protein [Deltaproteobacteria bacterium]|nr:helix-turn-helix domain-containing protein [Deltaproteobacteria bacterium]